MPVSRVAPFAPSGERAHCDGRWEGSDTRLAPEGAKTILPRGRLAKNCVGNAGAGRSRVHTITLL